MGYKDNERLTDTDIEQVIEMLSWAENKGEGNESGNVRAFSFLAGTAARICRDYLALRVQFEKIDPSCQRDGCLKATPYFDTDGFYRSLDGEA